MPKMIKIDKISNTTFRLYIYSDNNSKKITDLVIGNIYKISYFVDINDKISDIGELRKITINNSNKFTITMAREDQSQIKITSDVIDTITSSSFLKTNKTKNSSNHTHENKSVLNTFTMTQEQILNEIDSKVNTTVESKMDELKEYVDEQITTGGTGRLDGGEF